MRILATALLAFVLTVINGAEPKEKAATMTDSQSLKAWLVALDKDMRSADATVRKKAFSRMLITQDELKILFPKDSETLWKLLGPYHTKILTHVDEVAKEITSIKSPTYQTINLRKKDASQSYVDLLAVIPKGVPVFRLVKRGDGHSSGSSSYVKINGTWRWVQGLDEFPRFIKEKTAKDDPAAPTK